MGRYQRTVQRAREKLARTRPTPDLLVPYLRLMFDIPVPDEGEELGQHSPGEHARTMYRGDSAIVAATRDSYKTLVGAAVEFLTAHHDGLQWLHFGAFDIQAKQTMEYLSVFASLPWWSPHVRAGNTEAKFRSGGYIRCRPLTAANARSAHVQRVTFDEADECRPDLRRIAVNIASSRGRRKAATCDMSTKNRAHGPIANMIENAPRSGHRVLQWNYKAVTERCPDERSGTEPARVWVSLKYLIARSEEEPPSSEQREQEQWTLVDVHEKCPACPIVATCRGDLKHARGELLIDDLIAKFTDANMTAQDWRSQRENIDPSVEGLVVPDWNEALAVSEDAVYDKTLPVYCAQDFGLQHLAVTLLAQHIPLGHYALRADGTREEKPNQIRRRFRVIDEYVTRAPFSPDVVDHIAAAWFDGDYEWPRMFWIDPSGAPAVQKVRAKRPGGGYRTLTLTKGDNRWKPSTQLLRGICSPLPAGDRCALEVHPRCERLRLEMGTVKHPQDGIGRYLEAKDQQAGNDDAFDTMRYLAMGLDTPRIEGDDERRSAIEALERGGLI